MYQSTGPSNPRQVKDVAARCRWAMRHQAAARPRTWHKLPSPGPLPAAG
jgi:hypothetical protein